MVHKSRFAPDIYMQQQQLKSQGLCRSIRALLSASSQISGAVQCRCVQNLPSNRTDYYPIARVYYSIDAPVYLLADTSGTMRLVY